MADQQIGSLLIALEANTAKLDEQIKQTKANFTDLNDIVGLVQSSLAGLGIGLVIKDIVDQTAAAEKAQALLESQIKATGDASGLSLDQLTAMSEAFQQTTTSSHVQIQQLESELMAFRNIAGAQFQGAIQAALDFAAVTGRDASEAVRTLGMALNDPINGMTRLTRAGIDLDAATKETIKSLAEQGDLVGAQTIILQAMEKSYGGAAAAARDTLGGALVGLKNDFDSLMEGDKGGISGVTNGIQELDKAISDPEVKKGIANLVSGLLTLVGVVATAAAEFASLGTALGEAFARATGATGNFDDQISSLNGKIFQTKILLEEAWKADPSGQSKNIQDLQLQLAQYQYQLKDVQLYQKAITGGDGTVPKTYQAGMPDVLNTGDFKTAPAIHQPDEMGQGNFAGLKSGYDQMVEDQQKVMEIWKQNDPSAYLQDEIDKTQALVGTVVNGQIFTADDATQHIAQLDEEWKRHTDAMTEATQTAGQSMQQDLQEFFFDPFNEGLDGLLKAFISTIQQMLAQWAAAQIFTSLFGSSDASGKGSGSAGLGDLMAGFFGGHRAGGGPVSAGTLYQVNEGGSGSEGFIPSTGGSIIPLGVDAGSKGGDVNVSYAIHMGAGADGGSAAQLLQFAPVFRRQIHSDIEYWRGRGAWPA